MDYWHLPTVEQESLLSSILPEAIAAAQEVLDWLDEDRIVITNRQDGMGHFLYLDRRTEEKQDSSREEVRELSCNPQPWWKFW